MQVVTSNAEIVVRILDLAVLSFSGAHLEPFDEMNIGRRVEEFGITGVAVLRRRRMRCLDTYLDRKEVWVFEVASRPDQTRSTEQLYLSACIEDFNTLWGPVWSKSLPNNGPVIRYDVGPGSLIPWERADSEPSPEDGETFCHWTRESNAIIQSDEHAIQIANSTGRGLFSDRLLIGGILQDNPSCTNDVHRFTTDMRDDNRLHPLTHHPTYELETTTICAQIVGLGIGTSYSETYKRRGA